MKALLRRWVPLGTRQHFAQARRRWRDYRLGVRPTLVRSDAPWPARVWLAQPVMPSQLLENKLANLARGAAAIHQSAIAPGAVWSFWSFVGRPTMANGFVEGRNIVDGRLVREVGGGLCQLSSLVYHLALLGGLEIIERHPHSIDIYREEDRFTPLGADATVVWGFKDLRLRNPHTFTVLLRCEVRGHQLEGELGSEPVLPVLDIRFDREPIGCGRVRVHTCVADRVLRTTDYEQRQGLALETLDRV